MDLLVRKRLTRKQKRRDGRKRSRRKGKSEGAESSTGKENTKNIESEEEMAEIEAMIAKKTDIERGDQETQSAPDLCTQVGGINLIRQTVLFFTIINGDEEMILQNTTVIRGAHIAVTLLVPTKISRALKKPNC